MTDSNYTAFCLVMDRSGSMASIQNEAQGAINGFVEDQKKLPGKATLTFVRFDNHYEEVFSNKPIQDVGKLELEPRGMTALWDAVGSTIVSFGQALAAMDEKERPGKVLFIIVTDGHENNSKKYTTLSRIHQMITEQKEKWNWEFIFLAANMDAGAVADDMGIGRKMSQGWAADAAGAQDMGVRLSAYSKSYRSTGIGDWGDEDH